MGPRLEAVPSHGVSLSPLPHGGEGRLPFQTSVLNTSDVVKVVRPTSGGGGLLNECKCPVLAVWERSRLAVLEKREVSVGSSRAACCSVSLVQDAACPLDFHLSPRAPRRLLGEEHVG